MNNYTNFAITTIIENSLYAVEYNNTGNDEFHNLFENWSDVEYLEAFFEKFKSDLQSGFYGNMPIEDAIFQTINEAEKLDLVKQFLINEDIIDNDSIVDFTEI